MVKRTFDVFMAGVALIFSVPVLLVAVVGIKLSCPGPVLFVQERVGLNGRIFSVYKLRTMVQDPKREERQVFSGHPDVFPFGAFLRRFKIDELPQIWHVVVGDMSLVGPRPCLPQTAEEMPDWARRRFSVRPGLTGLAQVSGNIFLPWEDRWRYDVSYVHSRSFVGDLVIIGRTVLVLLFGEQIRRLRP